MANETGFKKTKNFESIMDGTDFCRHVSKDDTSKGVGFFYEKDSCGYVYAEIVCEPCRKRDQKRIDESMVSCHDCGQQHPSKNVRAWRWYDFYAPQGDEPRMVCVGCWELPAHVARMKKDDEDYRFEHGIPDEPEFEFEGPDEDEPYFEEEEDDDEDQGPEELWRTVVYRRNDVHGHHESRVRWSHCIKEIVVTAFRQ